MSCNQLQDKANLMKLNVEFDINDIEVDDLYEVSSFRKRLELFLSLPPFIFTIICLMSESSVTKNIIVLVPAFYFYLAGLRQAHGAFHYSLGYSRLFTDLFLLLLSVPMLIPLHCVQVNHMVHHKHLLESDDIEGRVAHRSALGALLSGPLFYLQLMYYGYKKGNSRQRFYQRIEVMMILILCVSLLCLIESQIATSFIVLMLLANCFSAFFAVWTVHRDSEDTHLQSRSQRGWLKSILVMNMFYHLEHHLFPRIHTSHWSTLAERLDPVITDYHGHKDVY